MVNPTSRGNVREILNWLAGFEMRAARFYEKAARYFESKAGEGHWLSELSRRLSEDEHYHATVIKKAKEAIEEEGFESDLIQLDSQKKAEIEKIFNDCEALIDRGSVSEEDFLNAAIKAEHSEWNNYFVYAVGLLKGRTPEFAKVVKKIEAHKARIEDYIKGSDSSMDVDALLASLDELSGLPVERCLLAVDDEAIIVHLIASILESYGEVDSATNGAEALELYRNKTYDCVITDITMPVMDGIEFYKEAKKLDPELPKKTIFISAAIDQDIIKYLENDGVRFIHKPARMGDITKAVSEVLGTEDSVV